MNAKHRRQAIAAVTPSLCAGERIDAVAVAAVGSAAADSGSTACRGTPLLSGSAVIASAKPRTYYVVMTDHRLIMLRRSALGGPSSRRVGQVLRDTIVAVRTTRSGTVDVSVAGRDKGLRLTFGMASRSDGRDIATALATAALSTAGSSVVLPSVGVIA